MVGLALDEHGIPKTAEGRFEVAKRIVAATDAIGIPRGDVYIDCLTLTVSAEQSAAAETLKAITMCKRNWACAPCWVFPTSALVCPAAAT